ncbi:MAG: ferredoxin, partial [Actinobacteria bacterium]|nr:ferredoxin [Actinomycetota bacterium]
MRIKVDTEKCQGHNRCYSLAPELFDVDDYGYATEIDDGTVSLELVDKAKLAAANCTEV